jgi:hypothetical protein
VKWSFFLRALFPSWRFFVETGPRCSLQLSVAGSEWRESLPPIARHWRTLLVNPEAGFLHAAHNSLEHLLIDVAELKSGAVEELPSYRVVKNLTELCVREEGGERYRFRVLSGEDVALISPEYEVAP